MTTNPDHREPIGSTASDAPPDGAAPDGKFDHLVIILRDRLAAQSPQFGRAGYTLTPIAHHNLGSSNRLITLRDSYIELLGWPAGTRPRRAEIAEQPPGPDALVLRTHDARATHARLRQMGLAINPVQRLERPITVDGRNDRVRFDTVRFARQPLSGLRLYFCQHLTPWHVWNPAVMRHANGAWALHEITLCTPRARHTAEQLAQIADSDGQPLAGEPATWQVNLGNLHLRVVADEASDATRITGIRLAFRDGATRDFHWRT